MGRILSIDPGDARIGLALSDPSRTLARPLEVLKHTSRQDDARRILERAKAHQATAIVVGIAYDSDGSIGPQARKGLRLVKALQALGDIEVHTWDESETTKQAETADGGVAVDARAAAFLLQDFLDAQRR